MGTDAIEDTNDVEDDRKSSIDSRSALTSVLILVQDVNEIEVDKETLELRNFMRNRKLLSLTVVQSHDLCCHARLRRDGRSFQDHRPKGTHPLCRFRHPPEG